MYTPNIFRSVKLGILSIILKIFVTPSVLKLQKWFLHQNGVEFNQCLAVPELPNDVLKVASDLLSVI